MSLRIVLIGTVAHSRACLAHLIEIGADIAGVVTRPGSTFNSDFARLDDLSETVGIPCLLTKAINGAETIDWIRERAPDVIFCFGWSQLIRAELLNLAPLGIVGYHPAMLPRNRGRHPLIWALVLGLEQTGSTFFFMDEGADSGDILSQDVIDIAPEDDAGDLYQKMTRTALAQISDFLPRLEQRTFQRVPQDHGLANNWRKRGAADGRIDWRMPTTAIHNLVRALARPYPGATFIHKGRDIFVWKSQPEQMETAQNLEPGQVLAVSNGTITIKTGDGAIRLLEIDLTTPLELGTYL
jgi:methionyl-tRNA formyltransferase